MKEEVIFYLLFLIVGFILGRMGVKNDTSNTNTLQSIKRSNLNPLNAYKERVEKREQEQIEKEMRLNLENVNNYDGTDRGQKDIE